jgi:phospholipid transport system substrate-binding protein
MVVEGISLVNNYRTQFSDILAKSSFEGLMKKLKEKSAE